MIFYQYIKMSSLKEFYLLITPLSNYVCIARNKEVVIVEKNNSFGVENSSRNSGVIHAGIYYKNGSLKLL